MTPSKNRQEKLFLIAGVLILAIGLGGVLLVLKIILETGDLSGVLSRYWGGMASILVLIGCGVFILRNSLRNSSEKTEADPGK